jgi:protein MpaA
MVLGMSVQGRPITAVELGDPTASRRLVVFGCIHGNEPAGIAIARQLEGMAPPAGTDVWVIEDLNPDGVAADTRQNADGVDLNRNFPYGWAPLGSRGSQQYAGSGPLSEPESRAAYDLLTRLRPTVTIWFHQPLGLVDESGGDPAVEQRYAALVGLPVTTLERYPGSAPTWENHTFAGTTAFVVELAPGALSAATARRYAVAALQLVS